MRITFTISFPARDANRPQTPPTVEGLVSCAWVAQVLRQSDWPELSQATQQNYEVPESSELDAAALATRPAPHAGVPCEAPFDIEQTTREALARARRGSASGSTRGRQHLAAVTSAMERGDPDAALQLATYFDPTIQAPPIELEPEEVPAKNPEKAARYYRQAAHQGSVDAAFGLGCMLTSLEVQGTAAPRRGSDFEEGVRWLKYAALQGDQDAQVRLRVLVKKTSDVMLSPGLDKYLYAPLFAMLREATPMVPRPPARPQAGTTE